MGEERRTKAGAQGCKVHMSAQIPKFGHHTLKSSWPAAETGQEGGKKTFKNS